LWGLAARPDVYGNGALWTRFGFKRDPKTLQVGEVIKVGGTNGGSSNNNSSTNKNTGGGSTDNKGGGGTSTPVKDDTGGGSIWEPIYKPKNSPEYDMLITVNKYTVYSNYSEYKRYISRSSLSEKVWGAMASEAMTRISYGFGLNIWIGAKYPKLSDIDPRMIYIQYGGNGEDGDLNPFYQVRNSCLIDNHGVMLAVIDFIISYNKGNPLSVYDKKNKKTIYWNRTRDQMLKEWKWHNKGFYSPFTKKENLIRYQHVDFDNADYGPTPNLRLWGR